MKTRVILLTILMLMGSMSFAREDNGTGIPLIGSVAPSFTAETTNGKLTFPQDFGNNWKILFSHPQDFTPVCTSELIELTRQLDKFDKLGVKVAVISTDTKERHLLWKNSIEDILRKGKQPSDIRYPLIDDSQAKVADLYGMLHKPVSTTRDVRGVYIIDPSNILQAVFFYPPTIGRNIDEILRTVQALQKAESSECYTPVNWQPGDDLLFPRYPYDVNEVADETWIDDEFYFIGSMLWFKKADTVKSKVDDEGK